VLKSWPTDPTQTDPTQYDSSQLATAMKLDGLFDLARRVPRIAGRRAIKAYRYSISPLIGFHCRHLPTCSEYGYEAIDRFGLWIGGWMTLARICRCHPYGTSGLDFVPRMPPSRARWYAPWRYGLWRRTNAASPR